MEKDTFIEYVVSVTDPNVVRTALLSNDNKEKIKLSLQAIGNADFVTAHANGATAKFKFSKEVKKALDEAIDKHLPKFEAEEGKTHAKKLVKDYEWVIQNAHLLKRIDMVFGGDKASSIDPNLKQLIDDQSKEAKE